MDAGSSKKIVPPFVSNNSPSLLPQEKSEFQRSYLRGVELRRTGNIDSAIVFLRSAIASDSSYADAHYQLAKYLEEKGRFQDALSHYIHGRDFDELRFRTDSRFNDLIRSMNDEQNCSVADIERTFKLLSPDSLVGSNLIFEHLHPNARGYFVIAKQLRTL
ncbi:MAG: tetratricopeptide repeat domain protein [Bacteroidetes bacterium]|nr:tetratricopeptide repeat domain protein [Bacteroidota bacterium]